MHVSPEFVKDSCELGLAEMLRGGTTTCNDMYWFPEVLAELVDRVGLRAVVGLILIDFPTAYASSPEQYLEKGLALYEQRKHHPRLSFALAPHAPYTVCDANLSKVAQLAREVVLRNPALGSLADTGKLCAPARVHIHLHETKAEVDDSSSLTPSMACHRSVHKLRPLANLDANIGLVDENLMAVHMTQLTTQEIDRLAVTHSSVVHCATSNLKLGSGLCPVSSLLAKEVNVALGTDSTASNNSLDMFSELKLAAILAKGITQDPTVVPSYQALKMATINGAIALGLEQQIGSLEVGKAADFISVRMDSIETLPLFSVFSHLVYVASRHHVENVWVAGKRLMRGRQLLTLDENDIKKRATKWQNIMAEEKAKQAAAAAAAEPAANGKKRGAEDEGEQGSAVKPKTV